MRILTLSLIMTCVACAQAPKPALKSKAAPVQTSAPQTENTATQDAAGDNSVASNDQIQDSEIADIMSSAPATPIAMDQASMEQQVQAVFAQNSNLSPAQSSAMSETSIALINAANAGDQAAVKSLSNQLLKQAVGAQGIGIGFGLVDPAAIVAAIMDLIAAAMNADVAGIIDALMDLAAAFA